MIQFLLVFVILFLVNHFLLKRLSRTRPYLNIKLLSSLYVYHTLFFGVYYLYALGNPSDSVLYYSVAEQTGAEWPTLFRSGTDFISFLAVPMVYFKLPYSAVMLIYSWMGYIGFVYAYLFFKENISVDVKIFGQLDFLTLLLFLPNMHFWTVSLGKGAVIFMGLMLFTYAIGFPKRRILLLVLGAFLIYMVRPHVMLFVLVGVILGLWTGKDKQMSVGVKVLTVLVAVVFLYFAWESIIAVANLENSEDLLTDFEKFTQSRSEGLADSGSGVNMNNYPLPLKLFTFWFRPLFWDSPGILGLFSSIENLLYLYIFYQICNRRFITFIRRSPYLVKMSAIVFLLSSFALTFVMSNLGIIIRQKSMVMYFAFFVIYYFLAQEKYQKEQLYKQSYGQEHIDTTI